ncbi:MAG: tetratricopeptide repeat protein [Bacteroidota bacterium]|nr:tetratricopeptide repeat protein [Bacteroidota bacterium]
MLQLNFFVKFSRSYLLIILSLFSCIGDSSHTSENIIEIDILSEKINKNPSDLQLLLKRANYYRAKQNWEHVLFDAKQCLSLDSANLEANFLAGESYFEISKINHTKSEYPYFALNHLKLATNVESKNFDAFLKYAEILIAFLRYKEAIEILNRVLKINNNLEKAYLLKGYILNEIGDPKQALDCFYESIQVNPEFIEGHIQLGNIFHKKNDTLALIYYDNVLKIDSNNLHVLYAKGVFFQERKEWNNALKVYSDLHKIDPFHADAHYNVGFVHMELDLFNIAVNNFSDAIYTNSQYYQAYYSRGYCFETLGNIMQAKSDYQRAIEINPNYNYAVEALKRINFNNQKISKQ